MTCLECGNCKEGKKVFFCPARNEFEIRDETVVREKENSRWKKGDPRYEQHRRRLRKDREDLKIS